MKNKESLITKVISEHKCYTCLGEGSIIINEHHPLVRELCTVCEGTGVYKDCHYIIIDEKNKIAIDSDCGG